MNQMIIYIEMKQYSEILDRYKLHKKKANVIEQPKS